MSDTRFTASNGFYVQDEWVYRPDGEAWLEADTLAAVALIEYGAHKAQADRDAELGRWRSVDHPDWVVYPLEREDHVDLLNERNLHRLTIPRSAFYHIEEEDEAYAVKAEYWAAHPVPEPKPWEQAETGEVWVLTVDGDDTRVVTSVGFEFQDFHGDCFRRLSDSITAGRRIWPEVSA